MGKYSLGFWIEGCNFELHLVVRDIGIKQNVQLISLASAYKGEVHKRKIDGEIRFGVLMNLSC